MSDTTTSEPAGADRDDRGRFQLGHKPGPGRPKGARDRHSRNFLIAFADDFEQHGAQVIAQVRVEKPDIYLKVAADLLPREATLDIDVSVLADVTDTLQAYRVMSQLVGADPRRGLRALKQIAPKVVIDAD